MTNAVYKEAIKQELIPKIYRTCFNFYTMNLSSPEIGALICFNFVIYW